VFFEIPVPATCRTDMVKYEALHMSKCDRVVFLYILLCKSYYITMFQDVSKKIWKSWVNLIQELKEFSSSFE
jgi:hypothetical protein